MNTIKGATSTGRGGVFTIMTAVIAASAVAGVVMLSVPPGTGGTRVAGVAGATGTAGTTTTKATKTAKRRAPTSAELRAALARCGLTPRTLAVAGVSAGATTTLVGNVRQYLTDHPEDLGTAEEAFFSAQTSYDQLLRKVQQGQSSQEEQTAFTAMASSLSNAKAGRDGALVSIVTAAVASLSEGQQSAIATVKSNAQWKLPTQYLVATRTSAQWVALRNALANDRQASAESVDPDPDLHQVLVDANAVPATTAAAAYVSDHLAKVTAAFNAAVRGG